MLHAKSMKTKYRDILSEMGPFLLFWSSQSFSSLGSAMTGYALVIWSYTQSGSALRTAMLMVSTYAPYVLLSIFAGALSDRWNKKRALLVCDLIAACTTVAALILLQRWRRPAFCRRNIIRRWVVCDTCQVPATLS